MNNPEAMFQEMLRGMRGPSKENRALGRAAGLHNNNSNNSNNNNNSNNSNNTNQNNEQVVSDDMIFKHLLEPMVDAGVSFLKLYPDETPFNPIAERGRNEAYSRRFRSGLVNILDDIVQGRNNGGENAPYLMVIDYLGPFLNNEQPLEDAEVDRLILSGIQAVKDAVQAMRNAVRRKEERMMAGEVVVKKKLPPEFGQVIGNYLGGRKKKTRRKSKSSRKSKTRRLS